MGHVYRGVHGAIILYDITNCQSWQNVQNWLRETEVCLHLYRYMHRYIHITDMFISFMYVLLYFTKFFILFLFLFLYLL